MNTRLTAQGLLVAILFLLLTSRTPSFAIEGIQISVQSSNAILTWPSTTNETYIIQYRPTLTADSSWLTLTDYFSAITDTNSTSFVDSKNLPAAMMTNQNTGFYRVVRDGVHLGGITNGMVLSNVLVTTIEFAVTNADSIVGITFYDTNNAPIIGAAAQSLGSNIWAFVWDTTMAFNGDHTIFAELDFASDRPVVSQPVTVTVNNVISFPNYFAQVFGDRMWVYAQTIPNAAYRIDMYDESTNYLGAFTGSADGNGTISFTWGLANGNRGTFDSTNFFGIFTVTGSSSSSVRSRVASQSGSVADFRTANPVQKSLTAQIKTKGSELRANANSSSASAQYLWTKEGNWMPNDYWVVAYSPLTDPVTDPNTSYKESLMLLGGPDGNYGGVIGTLSGNDFHGHLSPGNVPQTSAFQLADAASRANLLSYLASGSPQYENFYYFGHGNNTAISAYNGVTSGITKDQLANVLGNVP